MTLPRRLHRVFAVAAAACIVLGSLWPATAAARQTTGTTTTTRPVTTTTSTTSRAAPDEGRFDVTPRTGSPGALIRISNVVPNCPTPAGKTVLVAIGMGNARNYGSRVIATAATGANGAWGGTINVPDAPSGTYEMYASCFVQHPGQYDDEYLLPYSGPTFVVTQSPVTATSSTSTSIRATPASATKKTNDTAFWLTIAIVAACVLALGATIYAFVMRSRLSHGSRA